MLGRFVVRKRFTFLHKETTGTRFVVMCVVMLFLARWHFVPVLFFHVRCFVAEVVSESSLVSAFWFSLCTKSCRKVPIVSRCYRDHLLVGWIFL